MWAYGVGNSYGTPSWNQSYNTSGPSWDQSSNYSAQTGPTYASNGFGSGGMWGAAIQGLGGYFQSQAAAKQQQEMAEHDAQTQRELMQQQREFQTQDRAYRRGQASRWSKYFGG